MSCLRSTTSACAGEAVDADARAARDDVRGGDDDVRPRDPARAFDAEAAGGCGDPDDARPRARDRGRREHALVGRRRRRRRAGDLRERVDARERAQHRARRRDLVQRCRIADCCTSARSFVWPGKLEQDGAGDPDERRGRAPRPATRPPIESSSRSGGITASPPRANEPAIAGDRLQQAAPTSAPTSPASGV